MESEASTSTSVTSTSYTNASQDHYDICSSSSEEESLAESLLSRLKSLQMSDLTRKRRVCNNQPPKGKGKC